MNISAGWEKRTRSKAICRWFVAWKEMENGGLAGAVAGYSGGGSFIVERFFARVKEEKLYACWIDYTDVISGKEIEFDKCGPRALLICEECLDEIWRWNNHAIWSDTDEVILRRDKMATLETSGDMLFFTSVDKQFIKSICAKAGLTAAPKGRQA